MAGSGFSIAGSILFGLWHVASSLNLTAGNEGLTAMLGTGTLAQWVGIGLAVIATSFAGAAFYLAEAQVGVGPLLPLDFTGHSTPSVHSPQQRSSRCSALTQKPFSTQARPTKGAGLSTGYVGSVPLETRPLETSR